MWTSYMGTYPAGQHQNLEVGQGNVAQDAKSVCYSTGVLSPVITIKYEQSFLLVLSVTKRLTDHPAESKNCPVGME